MSNDNQDRPLSGTVALVTGASSGIGEATSLRLAGRGATVALAARRADRLEQLAETVTDRGGRAIPVQADTTDADDVRAAVDGVAQREGRLDVLVANAGWARFDTPEDADLGDWHRMIDVNLTGTLNCAYAALPHLLRAAEGRRGVADLVLVSSAAGRVTRTHNAVYSATKHAVNAFADGLRQNVTARYVRVGLVEPGMVHSELTEAEPAPGTETFAWLREDDIADAVDYMVTRPAHAAVNEILVRPTEQPG